MHISSFCFETTHYYVGTTHTTFLQTFQIGMENGGQRVQSLTQYNVQKQEGGEYSSESCPVFSGSSVVHSCAQYEVVRTTTMSQMVRY